jgi:hypothetical protein
MPSFFFLIGRCGRAYTSPAIAVDIRVRLGAAALFGGFPPVLRVSHVGHILGAFAESGQMLLALLIGLALISRAGSL